MENHKCKLCLKTFANGRALGGHIRSHSPSQSSSSFSCTVRQRSKWIRRSESSPEEAVAYCLMMLSRDKWYYDEEENEPESELEVELKSESDGEVIKVKRRRARNNYRCEKCNKVFRSYQALGGHIASHKKVKLNHQFHHNLNQQTLNVSTEDKIHECHVCFKVFASGQALGGHKRSHVTSKQVVKESINLFDLNLPAPSDR